MRQTKKSRATSARKSSQMRRDYNLCDKCGTHILGKALKCPKCGGTRFAPDYIRETRRITRFTSVRISEPHPESKSTTPVVTLARWWPGGRANFNLLSPAQWEQIKKIIDEDFAPILGWVTARTAQKTLASVVSPDLAELATQHPKQFSKFVDGLKKTIELPATEEGEQLYAALSD